MKTVILAGGLGSRLGELTETIPKPMITIGGKPIIWHIMKRFSMFGYNDFNLALGYKAHVLKDYFLNYKTYNSDFSIDLQSGDTNILNSTQEDWTISLFDTGLHSQTGGRLKRLAKHLGNTRFFLTYGDGLADIDIVKLLAFHESHGKMVTVSAVHPGARFGELSLKGTSVVNFREKPQTSTGWINGGYFVIEPEFINLISDDTTVLEESPLEEAAKMGEMEAYMHNGFWHCMDTKRDKDSLDSLWEKNSAPWIEK